MLYGQMISAQHEMLSIKRSIVESLQAKERGNAMTICRVNTPEKNEVLSTEHLAMGKAGKDVTVAEQGRQKDFHKLE